MRWRTKANFNIQEAKRLWVDGYCYNALGEKYKYCGSTIKKYIKELLSFGDRINHNKNHSLKCPKCYPQRQVKLI